MRRRTTADTTTTLDLCLKLRRCHQSCTMGASGSVHLIPAADQNILHIPQGSTSSLPLLLHCWLTRFVPGWAPELDPVRQWYARVPASSSSFLSVSHWLPITYDVEFGQGSLDAGLPVAFFWQNAILAG